jgi:hypothetical protein
MGQCLSNESHIKKIFTPENKDVKVTVGAKARLEVFTSSM